MTPAALPATALISFAVAFVAGWLACKYQFDKHARAAGERAAKSQEQIEAQRKRYRRRIRAMRAAVSRHKLVRDQLRRTLADVELQLVSAAAGTADLKVGLAVNEARLAELEAVEINRNRELEELRGQREALQAGLDQTLERVSTTQYEHGLLRIERDELAARTQRLAALSRPPPDAEPGFGARAGSNRAADEARAQMGALRETLAERDGLIHQLECRLQETESRAAELDTQLRNWKHRVAPLVLQLRIQRERNRKLRALLAGPPAPQATAPTDPAAADDLKEIRGIGRHIERKLHTCGIHRFRQLAEMAPGDLASMAAQLAIPASRPERDGWIDQARALHRAKYPDNSLFG